MLDRIIHFSIKNKLIIGLFIIALISYGAYEITRLPIDAVPDITNNQVQVITVTPSLGAPDVERLLTFPIEQANANIRGLKEIRSISRFGLSVVTIVFDDDVDVYWARQQVSERLQEVQQQIPKGLGQPKLAPVTTGLGEIYQYVLRPLPGYEEKYTPMELRTIQDWIVRRRLRDVEGVADVSSFGGYLKQYEIAVNTDKLKSYNVTINDVFNAVEKNNENTGGAYIEKGPTALFIRAEGLVSRLDDIENIPVKRLDNGVPVLLRDVASVRFGHATRYGALTLNGEKEVAGAIVMMLKGANSNKVIRQVKERIATIQKSLPEGVTIEPFLDRTKMVNNAIGTVEKNLSEGALIVLFVLVLFLGNIRAGALVASVIPLSMLFAIIMMNTFGVSGNLMSLGAIDFGLIVDGTVIIVEAVLHQMHITGKSLYTKVEMDELVHDTATRMRNAAVFGEVIIFIVYIPIFTLQGIEGKMFKPMAMTVTFALLGAFVMSLTYVPMMSSLVLSRKVSHRKSLSDRFIERLHRFYEPILIRVLNYPKLVILSSLVVVAVGVMIMSSLGGEFIPRLEEGDYAVETRVLPGSSLTTSVKAVNEGAKILKSQFPEVIEVVGKTGSSEIPIDPMPLEASDMIVVLKDKKDWSSAQSSNELTDKMSRALEAVPGVTFGFQYPVQMRFNELMTGARQDVVCKIFGEDLDTLSYYAKKLGELVNAVNGAADLYVETVTGMPQILINYDRSQMAFYGLSMADVNRVVNTAFAGQSTGLVFEGERRFDLVVRLSGEQRKNLEDVRNLLIPTPPGTQVPLRQAAMVNIAESANQIQRENAKRRIIVGFNVRGVDVQTIIRELQQKVAEKMKLPAGYYITYGGSFENLQAAKKRLAVAVPISLFLIFMMLYFAFGSIKQGLLIYSAIPLAAVGGVLALALRGMPFSISAGVGFIALFGVAVLNGIVLIAEFNRLRKEGMVDVKQIVIHGARVRLRPVLMTASVASLGFFPMALSQGAGAEVQRPLATVVIGGLITATLLTLFILPVLFVRFQGKDGAKPGAIAAACIATLLSFSVPVKGQRIISLEAAIDTAMANNFSINNERLNADYRRVLIRTAWDLPQASVLGEYGHISSYYTDNKIGISQSVSFPTVYSRRREVLDAEWQSGKLNVTVKEVEIKKQVSLLYFEMTWLIKKIALLEQSDSLYAEFYRKAQLRFQKGESNILEKATAETQRGKILQQRILAQQDLLVAQAQLKFALNTDIDYLPDTARITAPLSAPDRQRLTEHPYLRYLQQRQVLSMNEYRLERSKLLPDLSAGYFNQTFVGWQRIGNSDRYFDVTSRFSLVQASVGVPIFSGAQRSRINAVKIKQRIAQNNYDMALSRFHSLYSSLSGQYTSRQSILDYYRSSALANASVILHTASLQYEAGEINYLQYALIINQAISIRSEYLDAVNELNKVIVELNNISYQ